MPENGDCRPQTSLDRPPQRCHLFRNSIQFQDWALSLQCRCYGFHSGKGPDLLGLFAAGGIVAVAHLDTQAVRLLLEKV